jgi:hypothetical protein
LLAEGHLDGLLAVYDSYADRLFGYGSNLLGSDDAAIGAIRDALLVAQQRAATLTDPSRLGAWLYALTRNECVRRRRHASTDDLDGELASLVDTHRLALADIATIMGLSTDETTHRLRARLAAGSGRRVDESPSLPAPATLRAQLTAGAAEDAADYRDAVVRRAGPFGDDGFPQPLDQRRITGRALAWSTAAAVLAALALLVVLPGNDAASGTTLAGLPGAAAPSNPGLATLPQPSFDTRDAWPMPPAVSLLPRSAAGRPVEPAPTDPPTGTTRAPAPAPQGTIGLPPVPNGGEPPAADSGVVTWYQNRTAPACTATWVALVHAAVLGADPARVDRVVARWNDRGHVHPVALQRSGPGWGASLTGLPTGRTVSLVVQASVNGRAVTSQPRELLYRCS